MCKYWASKRCFMGETCNFAHSEEELRPAPDLMATKLCFQFLSKGMCSKGYACTFAHSKKDLRPSPKNTYRFEEMEQIRCEVKAPQSTSVDQNPSPPPGLGVPRWPSAPMGSDSESSVASTSASSVKLEKLECPPRNSPCFSRARQSFWL